MSYKNDAEVGPGARAANGIDLVEQAGEVIRWANKAGRRLGRQTVSQRREEDIAGAVIQQLPIQSAVD
jgi:hypothetical protein